MTLAIDHGCAILSPVIEIFNFKGGIMKFRISLVLMILSLFAITGFAATLDDVIQQAVVKQEAGDLEGALQTLDTASDDMKYNPTYIAYLGWFKGMMAGQAKDMMKAGQLSMESFQSLDKAIAMDSEHIKAHLFRGTMGVNVPEFMGKLDGGIQDLIFVVRAFQAHPNLVSPRDAIMACTMLIKGYEKKGQTNDANWARQLIVQIAPNSPPGQEAKTYFEENNVDVKSIQPPADMQSSQSPDVPSVKQKAQELIEKNQSAQATPLLKSLVNSGQADEETFGLLMQSLEILSHGYDESIHENTDQRTNMAFEVVDILDKAVQSFPENLNWRLARGTVSVMMPYFINRIDAGMEDLQLVIDQADNDSLKAEAIFWLGMAYQKKGQSQWYTLATDFPNLPAFKRVLDQTRPNIHRVNTEKLDKPVVTVELTHGFQDQLAPQTAVWVEDVAGKYIKTLYVSGFSGYVKEKQVVLPRWAKSSKFEEVESVTGASIDVGDYTYTWDCKDLAGNRVENGTYTVKVEVFHWPSYKHQLVAVPIEMAKENKTVAVEEGDFLPFVCVKYLSK